MFPDEATAIWNRACVVDSELRSLRPGDVALKDALAAHGVLMNGGLAHCLEVRGARESSDAIAGFIYFGRTDIAAVLRQAADVIGDDVLAADDNARQELFLQLDDEAERRIDALEAEYHRLVPDDDVLDTMFKSRLAQEPEAFAPVIVEW